LHFSIIDQDKKYSLANNKALLLLTMAISIAYVVIFREFGLDKKSLGLVVGLPLVLATLLNTNLVVIISIIVLCINVNALYYAAVVLFSFPVAVSYFITRKSDCSPRVANPLFLPIAIYLVAIIPSFVNVKSLGGSLVFMVNLISMIIMGSILGLYVKNYRQIKSFMIAFFVMTILNGASVVALGVLTKERAVGFTGIVFVDFVCLAILLCIVFALYNRNWKSVLYVFVSLFLFVSLIFTQTRNTIISLLLSFGFLIAYLFRNNRVFSVDRRKLVVQSICIVVFGVVVLAILSVAVPEVLGRLHEFVSSKKAIRSSDAPVVSNSVISRFLIWYTALTAFMQHPIVGIGAYSFYLDSQYYRTIPTVLYKAWVKGLSPHVAYLAVLTETGIVGMVGFLVFLVASLKMAFISVKFSVQTVQRYYSLGILICQVFICISMSMTDAYLWGQCGMLWSMLLGISVANYKMVMKAHNVAGQK
jgi:O-antigen ligase